MIKINWSGVGESITGLWKNHYRIVLVVFGLCVVILGSMFLVDRCERHNVESQKAQAKANIQDGLKEISNVQAEISEGKGDIKALEAKRDALKDQITADTQELANISDAREYQREATNQALANFNGALQTNSNKAVNVTAQQLEDIASKLH